ncbi:gasdermin-A isoform X1 [Fukomys damarensis]|uniref:gasdermin-A isoform X1 n=1 Tax=Fukomys damarensis TaxID=885580 RepID=UPI0005402515|nr:gasdermin-A isoform X1 [Fukomys damarensis]XP_010618318.1 gasdermin-A isoform X1 [Fukomys damarensis]XP_033618919.1 gasdermin-A isoform X1 [Fukomys damarensis]XP_033618920.1 gasdermin-A isoform X1 [Fukomys damarensis]
MRERGENLYVVMEVVETVQEVTLERAGKAEGCFSLPFFAPLGLQGSVNHKEAVTIPKGCVLAFRVRQLLISGRDEWDIPHLSSDGSQTFPAGEKPGEEKFTRKCSFPSSCDFVDSGLRLRSSPSSCVGQRERWHSRSRQTAAPNTWQDCRGLGKSSPRGRSWDKRSGWPDGPLSPGAVLAVTCAPPSCHSASCHCITSIRVPLAQLVPISFHSHLPEVEQAVRQLGLSYPSPRGTRHPEGRLLMALFFLIFSVIQASDVGEVHEDFTTLKEEVQRETQEVGRLSQSGQGSLLSSLSNLLGKKKELQDLELELEGALEKGHEVMLEVLPKDILLSKESMGAILYFLGALTVLSEAQQKLLVKSMEKKVLPVQLKLVESTLEQNFLQDKEGVFPLRPELLSALGEEELTLTEALVGLSGLEVQRFGPQYTWDPDTLPRLCALYASLSLLRLLAGSP